MRSIISYAGNPKPVQLAESEYVGGGTCGIEEGIHLLTRSYGKFTFLLHAQITGLLT